MSLFNFRPVSPVGGMLDAGRSREELSRQRREGQGMIDDNIGDSTGTGTRGRSTGTGKRSSPPGSPPQKKCRICFQTDVLAEGALARGKEPISPTWTAWWRRKAEPSPPSPSLGTSATNGADDGFISPCACRGSMAWVHKVCLEEWRQKSARRDSFYSCEYCFVSYRFKHTWLAAILNSAFVLTLLTTLMAMGTFFVMAFIVEAAIPTRSLFADDYYGGAGGVFSNDGVFIPISPTRGRWSTKTAEPSKTMFIPIEPTGKPSDDRKRPSSPQSSFTRTSKDSATSRSGPTKTSSPSTHSTVSYFNIAYWLTGHSMDEREEAMNDFLLAMMDVGTLKVWAGTLGILGLLALLRDGTQWSLLVAAPLAFSTFFMHFSATSLFAWLFPIPALYGAYRFLCWEYEMVELAVDTFIKNVSSELENHR